MRVWWLLCMYVAVPSQDEVSLSPRFCHLQLYLLIFANFPLFHLDIISSELLVYLSPAENSFTTGVTLTTEADRAKLNCFECGPGMFLEGHSKDKLSHAVGPNPGGLGGMFDCSRRHFDATGDSNSRASEAPDVLTADCTFPRGLLEPPAFLSCRLCSYISKHTHVATSTSGTAPLLAANPIGLRLRITPI